jgi:hypothetical protein
MTHLSRHHLLLIASLALVAGLFEALPPTARAAESFEGKFFRGAGDVEYLQLLDISRRMLDPDPEFQNLPMLYTPAWNGFVEGPTWGAWWIQNSYGTTYCALPLLQEPYVTFLQNSQDLWFDQMGDGKRVGARDWVAPDGCLCDAASPGWIYYKQGDGRIDIHDWGMEFTAAGLLMQSELLLISRDLDAIQHYLPMLERCAAFIETRRDPEKNLFWAGPAGNLLAPSYAGCKQPDGSYGKAYLAGLSITYIAALDRLIELEKMAQAPDKVQSYTQRRDSARAGLAHVTTDEGYFLKSLDPDGTRHGVYGADRYGYFEAVCNHDAICFGVVPDKQARGIMDKMRSIPGLRPHDLIITNFPSLDDMYVEAAPGLWQFGTWVNGGHWTTCEARMIMAYYRLDCFEDAARAMRQILKFAREFRMDNPLVDFGDAVYQPGEPLNLCYDTLGAPAAMVRGLFEYLYRADALTLFPHIPPGITRLRQDFPVRFGRKQLYLATAGTGPITAVTVNGTAWTRFTAQSVELPYDAIPDEADIIIALGNAAPIADAPRRQTNDLPVESPVEAARSRSDLFPVITRNELPLRIGADSDGNSRFIGQLARARVFARALSAEEVAVSAENKPGSLDRDGALIADWDLGRRTGETVPNSVGDYLSARIVGQVELVDGPGGKVLQLDGQGYLEIAPDARLDLTSALTLEAWVRPAALPAGGARILDKSRVGTSDAYLLDTHPGNSLRLIVERAALSFDAQLPTDKWSHVAATVDAAGRLALFVNGKQVAAADHAWPEQLARMTAQIARLETFHGRLVAAGLGDTYEAQHARLAIACQAVLRERLRRMTAGTLTPLAAPTQYAAFKSYLSTTAKLCEGLEKIIAGYEKSDNVRQQQIFSLYSP